MKPLLLAAALLLLPVAVPTAACAQVAAGALPNSFDGPARPAPAAVPVATPAAALPVATTPANPRSEDVLRELIADAQAGTVDYALMSSGLADRVRPQEARNNALIQGFGTVLAVDFVGVQDGADMFAISFANAETQWVIGFDASDKVAALLFRPAPDRAPVAQGAFSADRSVITNPLWSVPPAAEFPASARANGIGRGRVELTCRPLTTGLLVDCEVLSETPAGQGFGQAALGATRTAQVQPQDFYTAESRVNFAMTFED